MLQPSSTAGRDQVIDTMIGLTRLSNMQRVILAGSERMELYLALRQRGFIRVATLSTCRLPKAQHAIGLIAGHDSPQTIEGALAEISPFLCTNAAVAILIDTHESGSSLRIRTRLQQMGFQIEAGVRCREGLVLSAYRLGFGQIEKAA